VRLCIALINRKPGTGKTTSAVYLAHALAERGPVLLADADPAASALEWSDLAADEGGFPFRVVGLPSKQLHQRLPDIARPDEFVVIDSPQIEDHGAIAGSIMRVADELIVTCAPTGIEINRTSPIRDEIDKYDAARLTPARVSVMLNRAIPNTNGLRNARSILGDSLGFDVLITTIFRSEIYAQGFGGRVLAVSIDPWRNVARELLSRAGMATTEDLAYLAESKAPGTPAPWWIPAREGDRA
jgi:chromosome partitioning protein